MIDVTGLRDIRRESPGEFYLAVVTAAAVVAIGVEQGILLAIALSLFRHVRHSYRPHTMMLAPDATGRWMPVPATPGKETEPGSSSIASMRICFTRTRTALPTKCAPSSNARRARCAGSSSMRARSPISTILRRKSIRDLLDELARQEVGMVFARVNPYLRSDMDRHGITAAIRETRVFTTLHEAIAAVRGGAFAPGAEQSEAPASFEEAPRNNPDALSQGKFE